MDDFTVYGSSFDGCLDSLEKVLNRCIETLSFWVNKIDGKGMIVLNILVWNLWAVLSLRQFILILYFKHFYLRFCFYIPLNNNFIIHYLLFYDVFYLWEFILNNCHFSYIKDYDGGILMECKIDPKLPYTDLSTMIRRPRQVR